MERDKLINLVSHLLAAANARSDAIIVTVCEELAVRLVREAEQEKEVVPNERPDKPFDTRPQLLGDAVGAAACPVCAARAAKQREANKRWRKKHKQAAE